MTSVNNRTGSWSSFQQVASSKTRLQLERARRLATPWARPPSATTFAALSEGTRELRRSAGLSIRDLANKLLLDDVKIALFEEGLLGLDELDLAALHLVLKAVQLDLELVPAPVAIPMATELLRLAGAAQNEGDLNIAIGYATDAAHLCEAASVQWWAGAGQAHRACARIRAAQRDHDAAREHGLKAVAFFHRAGESAEEADAQAELDRLAEPAAAGAGGLATAALQYVKIALQRATSGGAAARRRLTGVLDVLSLPRLGLSDPMAGAVLGESNQPDALSGAFHAYEWDDEGRPIIRMVIRPQSYEFELLPDSIGRSVQVGVLSATGQFTPLRNWPSIQAVRQDSIPASDIDKALQRAGAGAMFTPAVTPEADS